MFIQWRNPESEPRVFAEFRGSAPSSQIGVRELFRVPSYHPESTTTPLDNAVSLQYSSCNQLNAHRLDNLINRWKYSENYPGATIDHGFIVYEDFVLPITPMNHVDSNAQFAFDFFRYTSGVESRDSISAITNSDFRHYSPHRTLSLCSVPLVESRLDDFLSSSQYLCLFSASRHM